MTRQKVSARESVEHGLHRIQRQSDIGGVLTRGILILQAWGEGKANQSFLSFVGERGLVAIPSVEYHAPKLGHDPERVFKDLRRRIVVVY